MALNIISLNKFERTKKYHPNYIAEFELDGISVKCEIYTNARLKFHNWLPEKYGNSRFQAYDFNYAKMNGNLCLRIESLMSFDNVDDRKIERELRKILEGRI